MHRDPNALHSDSHQALQHVSVGEIYYHYKNPDKHYKIIAVALQEATEEPCIVYETMHGENGGLVWVRNLEDWLSMVDTDQGMVQRFTKLSQS